MGNVNKRMLRRRATNVHEECGDGWVSVSLELGVEEGEFGPFGVAGAEEEHCGIHFIYIYIYIIYIYDVFLCCDV